VPAKIDITGHIFGQLVAIKRTNTKPGTWLCLCKCGRYKEIYMGHLRAGSTKSCGCIGNKIDISNKRFHNLSVVELAYVKQGNVYWSCLCDCGNKVIVAACNLKKGNTKSCGCISIALQEETCVKKYGCKSSFQNEDVKDKFKKTMLKKIWRKLSCTKCRDSIKNGKIC